MQFLVLFNYRIKSLDNSNNLHSIAKNLEYLILFHTLRQLIQIK